MRSFGLVDPSARGASRFPCCISFIFVALIFVLKYSRRWRPPIGGCKKFEPPFRPEMSNLIHFFCTIPLPHTFCPTKTRFYPLWSTPEPPGASSLGPVVAAPHFRHMSEVRSSYMKSDPYNLLSERKQLLTSTSDSLVSVLIDLCAFYPKQMLPLIKQYQQ